MLYQNRKLRLVPSSSYRVDVTPNAVTDDANPVALRRLRDGNRNISTILNVQRNWRTFRVSNESGSGIFLETCTQLWSRD